MASMFRCRPWSLRLRKRSVDSKMLGIVAKPAIGNASARKRLNKLSLEVAQAHASDQLQSSLHPTQRSILPGAGWDKKNIVGDQVDIRCFALKHLLQLHWHFHRISFVVF